ncbi:MAG: DNA polymerase III subunit beta [Oscillospiraceae bacterium]|nr:DNA polymerase III subunit beta [Oscillospiraceae bacterium]
MGNFTENIRSGAAYNMKSTVNTADFKSAIDKLSKVCAAKSAVPSLKNISVSFTSDSLILRATDLEQFAKITLIAESDGNANFTFSDTGTVLKAVKFFKSELTEINFFPPEEEQATDANGESYIRKIPGKIVLICGGKKAEQLISNESEYPDFPELKAAGTCEYSYTVQKLAQRVAAIKYAVGTNETNLVLTGIHFNNCDTVTCNGYRLAVNTDTEFTVENAFTVPLKAIKSVTEILSGSLKISTDGKYIRFTDGAGNEVVSRLLDGKYMQYSDYTSGERTDIQEAEVNVKSLTDGLKYLQAFSANKSPTIWENDTLYIQTASGKFESNIDILTETSPAKICFSNAFMLDAFIRPV